MTVWALKSDLPHHTFPSDRIFQRILDRLTWLPDSGFSFHLRSVKGAVLHPAKHRALEGVPRQVCKMTGLRKYTVILQTCVALSRCLYYATFLSGWMSFRLSSGMIGRAWFSVSKWVRLSSLITSKQLYPFTNGYLNFMNLLCNQYTFPLRKGLPASSGSGSLHVCVFRREFLIRNQKTSAV